MQKRSTYAACEVAKLEGVTFHFLRHTYASRAIMNGMPIGVLSEHLGHKDTRITERHDAHLCSSYKARLVRENAPSFGFRSASGPSGVPSGAAGASKGRKGPHGCYCNGPAGGLVNARIRNGQGRENESVHA